MTDWAVDGSILILIHHFWILEPLKVKLLVVLKCLQVKQKEQVKGQEKITSAREVVGRTITELENKSL